MANELSEEISPEADSRSPSVNPDLLSYDFFKHMTNLTVLTLGGMLGLSGTVFAGEAAGRELMIPMGFMALSGTFAFAGQIELVEWAHRGGRPRWIARWSRFLTTGFFGAGVGYFLAMIHGTMG